MSEKQVKAPPAPVRKPEIKDSGAVKTGGGAIKF